MNSLSERLFRLLYWVIWAFFIYLLIRLEFMVWNWSKLSPFSASQIVEALVRGLRFDISAVFAVSVPALLMSLVPVPKSLNTYWDRGVLFVFAGLHSFFFIFNLIDVEFIHFVGRRSTADTLFVWREVPGKMSGFLETYWLLFLVNSLLILFFIIGVHALTKISVPKIEKQWKLGLAVLCAFLIFPVAIRGGFQRKPITFVHANVFASPFLNNFVLNSSFTFIKSFSDKGLQHIRFFSDQAKAAQVAKTSLGPSLWTEPMGKQNVVVIVMESFGTEYTGFAGSPSYTPFLDELAKRSLYFPQGIANARRSIEGIAAIVSGLPALMSEPFISSQYTSNKFVALPRYLAGLGYQTAFFHGGQNGTMYFDSFAESAGFQKYLGMTEYGDRKDFDGTWGIWDRPFFLWTVEQFNQFQSPFFGVIFSLSSHHPFRVPEAEKERFPEGPLPILKAVQYADDSLRSFFEAAQKQPWFENTLFVITADHTSYHFRPEYDNYMGSYEVPILFYHPKVQQWPPIEPQQIVSQADITPSILDFLGLQSEEQLPFGQSVFKPGDRVAVNFIDGTYLLFAQDNYLVAKSWDNIQMFDRKDRQAQAEISNGDRKKILENILKAQVQFFTNGMIDNQLYLQQ